MKSRKLASSEGENPSKRQRVSNDAFPEFRASFDALNNDCVLSIASFLPVDDLNTFGTINRRCRVLRRHGSLNQTRIATIVCSRRANETTSLESFLDVLNTARTALGNQYTYLRLIGFETVDTGDRPSFFPRRVHNVTKLELVALNPNGRMGGDRTGISQANARTLQYFPNVTELVLNGLDIPNIFVWASLLRNAAGPVAKVTCLGDGYPVNLDGHGLGVRDSLTDLFLDRSCFRLTTCLLDGDDVMSLRDRFRSWYSSIRAERDRYYILSYCQHLQRLSLKGATWCVSHETANVTSPPEPIPQEMLVKMVRSHETLRWLRSDLTQENIAMLQEERPEITFVSD